MKKSKPRAGQKRVSEIQLARLRLARAESRVELAKEQARLAKRRRKEARQDARRTKKQVKQAKADLAEARQALEEAEKKLARAGQRAGRRRKQTAVRPSAKTRAGSAGRKRTGRPSPSRLIASRGRRAGIAARRARGSRRQRASAPSAEAPLPAVAEWTPSITVPREVEIPPAGAAVSSPNETIRSAEPLPPEDSAPGGGH